MFENHFKSSKSITDIVYNTDIKIPGQVKRSNLYLDWLVIKSKYFEVEKNPLIIPDSVFPNKITKFAYQKNIPKIQTLIDKYYNDLSSGEDYIINSPLSVDMADKLPMLHKLVFIRGNVVWIDFGFNIGCEFGGKHPAVILKNVGETLIVAPLTSGTLQGSRNSEVVINTVFNLPRRDRYTSVTRITPVSIYRVDLQSPVGSIRSSDMRAIFAAMKSEWQF